MWEWSLLLLPVAAGSGWYAGRRSVRDEPKRVSYALNPAYFRGLNFLLNEQPDKAIDVFVEMLQVDSDTVETHLALGNLFRRRGEVDRAIRIHQNLIARPTLTAAQRVEALLELGQDYMRAGLYDRAESLFNEVSASKGHCERALGNLLLIYQQEREWERCLEVARRLEGLNGRSMKEQMIHYCCELATQALSERGPTQAGQWIRRGLALDRDAPRILLLQAQIDQARGDCKEAIKGYRRVVERARYLLPEVLEPLRECHAAAGGPGELTGLLERLYRERPTAELALALSEQKAVAGESGEANRILSEQLRHTPDPRVLLRLLTREQGVDDTGDEIELTTQTLTRLLENRPAYRCTRCGFEAKTLHWQCPSCTQWGSVRPVVGWGDCNGPRGAGVKGAL